MKSSALTLARPYARALFAAAKEQQQVVLWDDYLQVLATLLSQRKMILALSDPIVEPSDVLDFIVSSAQAVVTEAHALAPYADNFLRLLQHNQRLVLLPQIFEIFRTLRDVDEALVRVQLTVAYTMAAAQQAQFSQVLSKRLGRRVHLCVKIDNSIIGGAIIRAGDLVIDGSVQGKLQRLMYQLQG